MALPFLFFIFSFRAARAGRMTWDREEDCRLSMEAIAVFAARMRAVPKAEDADAARAYSKPSYLDNLSRNQQATCREAGILGLACDDAGCILDIVPFSPAYHCGVLSVGDRLVQVSPPSLHPLHACRCFSPRVRAC